ncbi:MAG: hypothetical protein CVU64_22590 [Deltaproteobacteria bacterium HGW-Deltaproteobacteria-21]|nr:MAG: hypothetical protein CVU64_22590 [Deltaproteobacteria bacterium HGW-Deltaproteobacteria-21]
MPYEQTMHMLDGGSVMAECGPMRLVISSFIGKVSQREMNVQAARASFGYLERVARMLDVLRRRQTRVEQDLEDSLAREMVRSVIAVGDGDLTPMAAVAGTIGDAVADYLQERGMTKVVVNNGGDIAVRLQEEESVRVGIRTDVSNPDYDDVLVLGPGCSSWGIATSGLGGRSLTRGIASAATIVASTASLADAAATAVANASFVEDDQVVQRYAEEVDPQTDIRGLTVTVKVGRIIPEKGRIAVSKAMDRAEELVGRGVILGALVAVGGQTGMTSFFKDRLNV